MARRRPQRPRDPSQLGKLIVDLSVGEVVDPPPAEDTAVAFARAGGEKGGKARAAKLSGSERSRIARKAAKKRWGRTRN
jgi:hypothetical protein